MKRVTKKATVSKNKIIGWSIITAFIVGIVIVLPIYMLGFKGFLGFLAVIGGAIVTTLILMYGIELVTKK